MYRKYFKRLLDVFIALLSLIVLSPFFIGIMIILLFVNKGKPFFTQARPGKNEKIFKIIKFRSMNDKVDEEGKLLADEERFTPIGYVIRKTSFDEVPQLINVLKGDMSLVGPRPLLPEYLSIYDHIQRRRHEVRPGITGLAQVKGRNKMLFSERLKNDVFYVDHLSLLLDIKIVFLTIKTVLFKTDTIMSGEVMNGIDDIGLTRNLDTNNTKRKVT